MRLENIMEKKDNSILNKISQQRGSFFYYYDGWANGKIGAITDVNGNNVYRFYEANINSSGKLIQDEHPIPEKHPIVATGIIAYWLHCRPNSDRLSTLFHHNEEKAFIDIFTDYTENKLKRYKEFREKEDPSSWRHNLEQEFYDDFIIPHEKSLNQMSMALLDFVNPSDRILICRIIEEYMLYLETFKTVVDNNNINERCQPKEQPKKVRSKGKKDYERFSFVLHLIDKKIELLYELLAQKNKEGKQFIDGDMSKHNDIKKALELTEAEYKEYVQNLTPDDLNKTLFKQVFSGKETDVVIIWKANANELLYLIDTLHNKYIERNGKSIRLLDCNSGPGIWELTRFRFMNGKPRKILDERTGKQIDSYDPIKFDRSAFSHHNFPKNTTLLDNIIEEIAPRSIKSINEEIHEDFNSLGKFRNDNSNSLGELKAEGDFRDTNHKNKFE